MLLDVFRVRLSFCVCAECILFTKYCTSHLGDCLVCIVVLVSKFTVLIKMAGNV